MLSFDGLAWRYAAILAPISDAVPAGADVRVTPGFDWLALREARRDDHSGNLRPGSSRPPAVDWEYVEKLAKLALTRHTKDLQIAMWLAEALARRRGWEGLSEGLYVVERMVTLFWDAGLHPMDEEDDAEMRWRLLYWFDSELASWLGMIPVAPAFLAERHSLAEYRLLKQQLKDHRAVRALRTAAGVRYEQRAEQMALENLIYEIDKAVAEAGPSAMSKELEGLREVRERVRLLAEALAGHGDEIEITFHRTLREADACERELSSWPLEVTQPPELEKEDSIPHPEAVEDPWQRGLAWLRLGRLAEAASLVEAGLSGANSGKSLFVKRLELAAILMEIDRYNDAVKLLEPLSEQIEKYQLQAWEGLDFATQVWTLMRDCYRMRGPNGARISEIEARLWRNAPWTMLREGPGNRD